MTAGPTPGKCDAVLQEVYAYVDGEVAEADVERLRRHLDDCAPCLEAYEVEAALKALVRRSCVDRAPAALRERIMASITRVTTTSSRDGVVTVSSVTRVTTTSER